MTESTTLCLKFFWRKCFHVYGLNLKHACAGGTFINNGHTLTCFRNTRNVPSSYRPITLVPILLKINEKLLSTKVKDDIASIISLFQFGFKAKHSTIQFNPRCRNIYKQCSLSSWIKELFPYESTMNYLKAKMHEQVFHNAVFLKHALQLVCSRYIITYIS